MPKVENFPHNGILFGGQFWARIHQQKLYIPYFRVVTRVLMDYFKNFFWQNRKKIPQNEHFQNQVAPNFSSGFFIIQYYQKMFLMLLYLKSNTQAVITWRVKNENKKCSFWGTSWITHIQGLLAFESGHGIGSCVYDLTDPLGTKTHQITPMLPSNYCSSCLWPLLLHVIWQAIIGQFRT